MAPDPVTHITNHLLSSKSLPVAQSWLSQFLANQRPGITPLHALTQTAMFRLLASDFTTSLSISAAASNYELPSDISNPTVKEQYISGPVPVQVLDIEDIGTSIWSQVEAIERIERGEAIRGREVIRTIPRDVDGDEVAGDNATVGERGRNTVSTNSGSAEQDRTKSGKMHRLVLQDAKGTRVIAVELKPVEGINIGDTAIGTKMLITNTTVARGMVLLEPACVTILGGRIETMDREWKLGRKARLLASLNTLVNTD